MSAQNHDALRQAATQHAQKQRTAIAQAVRNGQPLSEAHVSFKNEVQAYLSTVPEDERRLYWEFLALQLHENAVEQEQKHSAQAQQAVTQATQRARRFMWLLSAVIVALALTALLQMK